MVDDEFIVHKYTENFNDLWVQFSKNELEHEEHQAAKKIQHKYKENRDNKKQ